MGTFFTPADHLRATLLTAVCAVAALASTFFIVGCGGTVQAQRDIDFIAPMREVRFVLTPKSPLQIDAALINPPLSNRSFFQ
jgi:hypothetical protein